MALPPLAGFCPKLNGHPFIYTSGREPYWGLRYRHRSQKGKGTGAKKQMPQVTHRFPSSRRPSSLSCSRSGPVCLSAYRSFPSSGEVYNRRVPILPLDRLGQADSTPAPIRVSRKFFLIFQATCKNFRLGSYPLRQVATRFKNLMPERQWPATCFSDNEYQDR